MKRFIWLVQAMMLGVCCYAEADDTLEFTEVADNIFMFEGEIDELFASRHGQVSNVVFIIGKQAVAVVDTGASVTQGTLIKQAIRNQTQLPIKYVINTHAHPDHIFGNQAFTADAAEFIAHSNYAQELATKSAYYQQRMQQAGFALSAIVEPTRLLKATETIDLGDRPLRLIASARAHSNSDVMVYDAQTATLIAGDLVFVDHCPVIAGSLRGWQTLLAELQAMNFSLLIPGHGAAQQDKAALTNMQRYFDLLSTAVSQAIDEQIDLNIASNTLLQSEAQHWRLFAEIHPRNVIAAYTELEWE
jgi:quinoprotein relay system zinc metallohydrolase 2